MTPCRLTPALPLVQGENTPGYSSHSPPGTGGESVSAGRGSLTRRAELLRDFLTFALCLFFLCSTAFGQQPADRFITVNGLRIHYLDWGTDGKPPLIMLHGIGRVAHTFDHLAAHFTANYHVMAIDMRGHGDSDWDPKGAYLVEDYTKDIEAIAQQLRLKNIVIWGNSTGGRVAQVFAGLHPELVAAVIAEDVGPERPTQVAETVTRQLKQEDAKGWASEEELLASLKASNSQTPEEILRAYAHYGSKQRPDGRVIWKRDPAIGNGFVPTQLWRFVSTIQSPIIYVLGGRSTIVPASTQEELKKALPQVQIVTIPRVGHYPSEENTPAYLAIVDKFLSSK
jgi:esterase